MRHRERHNNRTEEEREKKRMRDRESKRRSRIVPPIFTIIEHSSSSWISPAHRDRVLCPTGHGHEVGILRANHEELLV